MKMRAKGRSRGGLHGILKRMAGPDTTKAGDPDFAAMFNRFIREKVVGAKPVKADTLGGRAFSKGIMLSDDEKGGK